MDEKRIYKFSLLLPVVVPILCLVLMTVASDFIPESLTSLLFVTVFSLVFGGLPYAVVAILLFIWMWDEEPRRIRIALLLSPIVMIAVFFLLAFVYTFVSGEYSFSTLTYNNVVYPVMFYSGFILAYGYFYVFVTLIAARLLRKKPIETLPE